MPQKKRSEFAGRALDFGAGFWEIRQIDVGDGAVGVQIGIEAMGDFALFGGTFRRTGAAEEL